MNPNLSLSGAVGIDESRPILFDSADSGEHNNSSICSEFDSFWRTEEMEDVQTPGFIALHIRRSSLRASPGRLRSSLQHQIPMEVSMDSRILHLPKLRLNG